MARTPVRYRNKKTGKVATYAQPIPRLEKSKDFDRVTGEPKKKTAGSGS